MKRRIQVVKRFYSHESGSTKQSYSK